MFRQYAINSTTLAIKRKLAKESQAESSQISPLNNVAVYLGVGSSLLMYVYDVQTQLAHLYSERFDLQDQIRALENANPSAHMLTSAQSEARRLSAENNALRKELTLLKEQNKTLVEEQTQIRSFGMRK